MPVARMPSKNHGARHNTHDDLCCTGQCIAAKGCKARCPAYDIPDTDDHPGFVDRLVSYAGWFALFCAVLAVLAALAGLQ